MSCAQLGGAVVTTLERISDFKRHLPVYGTVVYTHGMRAMFSTTVSLLLQMDAQ